MKRYLCLLFCALFVLSLTDPILAKRNWGGGGSGRHSYPSSGGHSGVGSNKHSYPSSSGLSGGSHGYPSPGHGYPSSGNSHGYPSSSGMSGNSPANRGHQYGGAGNPSNTQHSNSHAYPNGKGFSGNTQTGHTTNVHYHYNYNPPQQIRYTPSYGQRAVNYPVYHGSPPTYVYQYKDSGSKYGTLLAGLALLNLGTVAAGAYALSHSHSNYKPQAGEVCKFGVKKDNGDYEETKIDCQLITSFIFQDQTNTHTNSPTNTTTVMKTTFTNTTTINMTHPETGNANATTIKPNPIYEMLPNGTLVLINVTATNMTNVTGDTPSAGNSMTSVTVITTNTTTVTNALDVKGKPIEVTPGMQCFVIRHTPSNNMRKSVPCGLLQTYAEKSLQRSSATRNLSVFTVWSILMALLITY